MGISRKGFRRSSTPGIVLFLIDRLDPDWITPPHMLAAHCCDLTLYIILRFLPPDLEYTAAPIQSCLAHF